MAATVNLTFRNLTDVFVLMRNNCLQNKNIFSEKILDDKVALVSDGDIERGQSFMSSNEAPPSWAEGIEDVQYEMSRVAQKLQELKVLHEKHLTRPSLDDVMQEEKDIDILTQDITRMFNHCKKVVQQIQHRSFGASQHELIISKNVINSLVSSLQELSSSFYSAQHLHLKKLRFREEKSQQFFGCHQIGLNPDNCVDITNDYSLDDNVNELLLNLASQQTIAEQNDVLLEQREREIRQVVHSLAELNDIFRELSSMVVDQGSVLDRIDYNLEKVQTHVNGGLRELKKAESMHKKNRKMFCIILMACATIILITVLVFVKA